MEWIEMRVESRFVKDKSAVRFVSYAEVHYGFSGEDRNIRGKKTLCVAVAGVSFFPSEVVVAPSAKKELAAFYEARYELFQKIKLKARRNYLIEYRFKSTKAEVVIDQVADHTDVKQRLIKHKTKVIFKPLVVDVSAEVPVGGEGNDYRPVSINRYGKEVLMAFRLSFQLLAVAEVIEPLVEVYLGLFAIFRLRRYMLAFRIGGRVVRMFAGGFTVYDSVFDAPLDCFSYAVPCLARIVFREELSRQLGPRLVLVMIPPLHKSSHPNSLDFSCHKGSPSFQPKIRRG